MSKGPGTSCMSDEIFVIDPGGHIGESTMSEIEYAVAHGKTIRYLGEVNMS